LVGDTSTASLLHPKPIRSLTEPPIVAVLPRASLPQMLRLLGALRRIRHGSVTDVVNAVEADSMAELAARRALEILRRVGVIDFVGSELHATAEAEKIDSALRGGDLDSISLIFERFKPYKALRERLRAAGSLRRGEVTQLLESSVGAVSNYDGERLPRFHSLLGQAWIKGDLIQDGSQRLTDRDAVDAFVAAFGATASDGFAKVVQLLPIFCENTRMSPWAGKRCIERLVAEKALLAYSFQPSAGTKSVFAGEVIAGNLDQILLEQVAIDRIRLGEQPVFTVGGPL
jgi:hypothetical protein